MPPLVARCTTPVGLLVQELLPELLLPQVAPQQALEATPPPQEMLLARLPELPPPQVALAARLLEMPPEELSPQIRVAEVAPRQRVSTDWGQ